MPFADIMSTQIDSIVPGSNAEKAGLQIGDRIISVDGVETSAFSMLLTQLAKYKETAVDLKVVREQDTLSIQAFVDIDSKLGFSALRPQVSVSEQYGFFRSFPVGISLGVRKMAFYVLQLKLLFTKAGISNIGGFGAIGNLFPESWNWLAFWMMTALLSIMLGVMNLLPIPALDGGHVLFLIYEAVTGRQPNEKFMEYAQMTGMALLIGLLLYANGMDIVRAFFS
jgi:regulator of sigma E protease